MYYFMNPGQARELKKAFTVPNSELMDRRIHELYHLSRIIHCNCIYHCPPNFDKELPKSLF